MFDFPNDRYLDQLAVQEGARNARNESGTFHCPRCETALVEEKAPDLYLYCPICMDIMYDFENGSVIDFY